MAEKLRRFERIDNKTIQKVANFLYKNGDNSTQSERRAIVTLLETLVIPDDIEDKASYQDYTPDMMNFMLKSLVDRGLKFKKSYITRLPQEFGEKIKEDKKLSLKRKPTPTSPYLKGRKKLLMN